MDGADKTYIQWLSLLLWTIFTFASERYLCCPYGLKGNWQWFRSFHIDKKNSHHQYISENNMGKIHRAVIKRIRKLLLTVAFFRKCHSFLDLQISKNIYSKKLSCHWPPLVHHLLSCRQSLYDSTGSLFLNFWLIFKAKLWIHFHTGSIA